MLASIKFIIHNSNFWNTGRSHCMRPSIYNEQLREKIIHRLQLQMCRLNHKAIDDKHKDEYIHE